MRSVAAGSYQRIADLRALWRAYLECRSGKRRQPRMAMFDLDADRELCALQRELLAGRYQPSSWRLQVVHDPKVRLIAAPEIRDRVLQRALLDEIGPCYERSYIEHSYTGGVGRGPHRAVLQYLRWMRFHRYRLHLDIRRYFPSIHHPTVCRLLFRKLRDDNTRDLIRLLLRSGGEVYRMADASRILGQTCQPKCGLPLGSYFSQWCGTFYLDGLDHFVKRELKISAYLRYMDDFVLFGNDQNEVRKAREAITVWLAEQRALSLNNKRWHILSTAEPGIFLGYRISRSGISPSRKLRRRMEERLWAAAERGYEPLVRTIDAYRGLFLF